MSTLATRMSLPDLVSRLTEMRASKIDFCADAHAIRVHATDADPVIRLMPATPAAQEFLPSAGYPIRENALVQLASRVEPVVPATFTRALVQKRAAIAASLLRCLSHASGGRYLVRCLDHMDGRGVTVRAFLSDRFRILDHYDAALTALDEARRHAAEVVECTLTDTHMRLKFVRTDTHQLISDYQKGGLSAAEYTKRLGFKPDPSAPPNKAHPYITISNSETGDGGLTVSSGLLIPRCANGAVLDTLTRAIHTGGKLAEGFYSEETLAADSRAIMLKARDAIRHAFTDTHFSATIQKASRAAADKIPNPTVAVNNLVENASLTQEMRDSILAHFLADYDPSRFGLAQAVSRAAQDLPSADDSHTLETISGTLISSPALLATP